MPKTDEPEAVEAAAGDALTEAAAPEAPTDPSAAKTERVAEIIRSHLRDTPLSRTDGAWNVLQSKLPAIAADILKEA